MREITVCQMCGRGICKPKVFCTQNCEEHWNSGFRIGKNYERTFTVQDWIVIAGNEENPKYSLLLQ